MVAAPKPDPANFRLSVKDFGPIVEADVDFRPLTVFVGPSNTGKSYLAVLTYALHQFLRDPYPYHPLDPSTYPSRERYWHYMDEMEMHEADAKRFLQWAKHLSNGKPMDWEGVEGIVRTAIEHYFDGTGIEIIDQIKRCFGIDSIDILHRHDSKGNISMQIYKDGIPFVIKTHDSDQHALSIPRLPQISPSTRDAPWIMGSELQIAIEEITEKGGYVDPEIFVSTVKFHMQRIIDYVSSRIFGALGQSSYYLPAGRSGMMHAHRTVASALVQNAQYAGIRRNERVILLSGISGDFLQYLLTIDPNRHLQFKDTAISLENKILKGDIRNVPTEAGYPDFRYYPEGWKDNLPLMNASSMVSELAPVVLFLRHIIQPNSVLIIDEPESHLHPAMQVEFTRVLAGAVKAGLRVILTTHSEWVVETVGNLVELWGVPESRRESLPGGEYALPPEDVGVWLFQGKEGESGSVVTEVERDLDTGVYGVGYDDVAMALNNEWANAAPEKTDSR